MCIRETAVIDVQAIHPLLQTVPYPVLFASIVGSHAYGCADEYSDYDVLGAHLVPMTTVLGLSSPGETIEHRHTAQGSKVEASTHDLKKFILLTLKGNGNVLEALYSPFVVMTSSVHEELKLLGKHCITKRISAHYKGMAYSQQRGLQPERAVKPLIHAYRCLLMGIHCMRHGIVELSLPTLAECYGSLAYQHIHDLLALKRNGETALSQAAINAYLVHLEHITTLLDHETTVSVLPFAPSQETHEHLEQLLIHTRLTKDKP